MGGIFSWHLDPQDYVGYWIVLREGAIVCMRPLLTEAQYYLKNSGLTLAEIVQITEHNMNDLKWDTSGFNESLVDKRIFLANVPDNALKMNVSFEQLTELIR